MKNTTTSYSKDKKIEINLRLLIYVLITMSLIRNFEFNYDYKGIFWGIFFTGVIILIYIIFKMLKDFIFKKRIDESFNLGKRIVNKYLSIIIITESNVEIIWELIEHDLFKIKNYDDIKDNVRDYYYGKLF